MSAQNRIPQAIPHLPRPTATSRPRVLVVHESRECPRHLVAALIDSGFSTETTRAANDLAGTVRACAPALILLDVSRTASCLPLCAELCRTTASPLMLLAAGNDESDRLLGFEMGAADYIAKPFSAREVIARMKAILRRTEHPGRAPCRGLEIDSDGHVATLDGHALYLTPGEFKLLALLASEPGRAFERALLFRRLYASDRVVSTRALDSLVRNLRRKLMAARPGDPMIMAVYGMGYRLRV